jgi:hypothetical protein
MAYNKKSSARENRSQREGNIPGGPRPATMKIGDDLEYRIARLFVFMGYFVRRSRPIFTAGALDQATDLDVVAIRYTEPFRRQVITVECKSGGEGPLDRIFWLGGVKKYVSADEAILIRKGTKWNIKDFAKEAGVQLWDLEKITEMESAFKIGPDDWPGVSDRAFYARELKAWNEASQKDRNTWDLRFTLETEIQFSDPFPGLNFLLYHLRLFTRNFPSEPQSSFHRHMIAETISQTAMFLMRIAERAFDLPEKDRTGFVEKGLTYGSVDPKFADRVLTSAHNLTKQTIFHLTQKSAEIDPEFFVLRPPPGTPDTLRIVEALLKRYPLSLTFPQITDVVLHEVFVKQNRSKGWLRRLFPGSDLGARVALTRDFIKLLCEAGACPQYVLAALSGVAHDNGSKTSDISSSGIADQPSIEDPSIPQHGVPPSQLELPRIAETGSESPETKKE